MVRCLRAVLPTRSIGHLKLLKVPSLLGGVCQDDFDHPFLLLNTCPFSSPLTVESPLKHLLFFCPRTASCGNLFAV